MSVKKGIVKIGLLGVITLLVANAAVLSFGSYVFSDSSALPNREVALIFGGGMKEDGSMTAMQTDRVIRGVALYKSGKVKKLMMTGDDGFRNDDEVSAMKAYAIQAGVPEKDVLVDPHGYRTYESCYRARQVYNVTSTIAISQTFHLARIAYICRNMGLETVGTPADLRSYGSDLYYMMVREVFARLKAVWQVEVTRPLPTSLEK